MRKESRDVLLKLLQQLQQKEDHVACDIIRKLINFPKPLSELDDQFLRMKHDNDDVVDIVDVHVPAEFIDARVRSLKFKNFRAFPDDRYGISFMKKLNNDETICSLFLVGANSSGKSTVCDALEYAYTGDVASVHHLTDVDLKKFLTFGFEDGKVKKEDVCLTLETAQNEEAIAIKLTTQVEPKCTASFFCSDNDVEELERCKEQIDEYLLNQLGYGELLTLLEKLTHIHETIDTGIENTNTSILGTADIRKIIDAYLAIHNDEDEKKKVGNIRKEGAISNIINEMRSRNANIPSEIENKERTIRIWKSFRRIPKGYFEEEWIKLINNIIIDEQNTIRRLEKRSSQIRLLQQKLTLLYEKLDTALNVKNGLDDIYVEYYKVDRGYSGLAGGAIKSEDVEEWKQYSMKLEELGRLLNEEIVAITEGFCKDNKEYLTSTMNSFSPSSEQFILEYSGGHAKAKIHSDLNGGFSGSPKTYYNTFRFKLYVIALKISLAFLYMRRRKIIVPIVIDDVFNANDFDNSIKLERFVYSIFKTYEETVESGIPLQLIVLTHDEMVQTAFRKGAKIMHERGVLTGKISADQMECRDFICGRLFHYTQAEEIKKAGFDYEDFDNLYIEI